MRYSIIRKSISFYTLHGRTRMHRKLGHRARTYITYIYMLVRYKTYQVTSAAVAAIGHDDLDEFYRQIAREQSL